MDPAVAGTHAPHHQARIEMEPMTARGQLHHRVRRGQDRLAWGFADLRREMAERGLWPARALALESIDGQRWSLTGTRLRSRGKTSKASGLLIPENECLWGTANLPDVSRQSLTQALEETLWRVSPLPRDQIVVAWEAQPSSDGGWTVEWGLCSRSKCDSWRVERGLSADVPVFFARRGRAFAVRSGKPQKALQHWMQALIGVLGVCTIAIMVSPALMPLVLEREAVRKSVRHIVEQEPLSIPIRHKLDDLRLHADLAAELRIQLESDLPLASLIEALTQVVPDDTWLDRIDINGREVRITGLTGNTTDLIAQVGRQPMFADVRATVASVRDSTLNKERFTLDMRWRGEEPKP